MKIIDAQQGSVEWLEARLGRPTASEADAIMARKRNGEPLKKRSDYLYKLTAERFTGPQPTVATAAMQRGLDLEPVVRDLYQDRIGGEPLTLVGFALDDSGLWGASPDALVGDEGLLEIKTSAPHIYLEDLDRSADCPARFLWQVVMQCLVTDRAWCDVAQYSAPLGALRIMHVEPTAEELEALRDGLVSFCADLDQLEARVLELLTDQSAAGLREAAS